MAKKTTGKSGDLFERSGGKKTASAKDNSYTARDIEVLEGLEQIGRAHV